MQEKHTNASPDTGPLRGSVQRARGEVPVPGAEQLMPSVFAHHLISTSGSLPAAGLFGEKGWTQPCHHGAIFIHEQKISELERTSAGKRCHIPLISGNSSSPDSGATSSSDAPFILPSCCTLLKKQKNITKGTKVPLYSFIVGFGFVLFFGVCLFVCFFFSTGINHLQLQLQISDSQFLIYQNIRSST